MKIYLSADFEGVCGIVDRAQCFPGNPEFERSRRLWVDEINAIAEGVLSAGASELVVNEAHAAMNYLLPELLHPKVSSISGYVKADNQMEGLDESFAGAVIMGHSRAGTAKGVLNHSYVMRDVVEVRLNGKPIGELGLNALWAAYLGVPVILVVGDDLAAAEIKTMIPEVETAVVKKGLSQFSAHNLPLTTARETIRTAARRAVERIDTIPLTKTTRSYSLEIEFSLSEIAHLCSFIPGVERIGARGIRFKSNDYRELQHVRIVCTNLALAVIAAHF
jgi:D-amino peptidase